MTILKIAHRYSRTVELMTPDVVASIDAGQEEPTFPFADASIDAIEMIDVLEHVTDEEAWLLECARVLVPEGSILVQVPRHGAMSWFESLNIYRYAVDVIGRGHDPREIKLIGWHRQYAEENLRQMMIKSGFSIQRVHSHSIGLAELPNLGRMIIGDLVRNDRTTGKRANLARVGLDRIDARIPAGPLSRRLLVTANRQ